ncbi:MAG: WbqC family protein [Burkholderiales bacterium]
MIQSNYIPWRGYFDFIDDCDLFLYYDDVQYTHRSWRNRNRIKTDRGLIWLSVPVIHDHGTLIQDARIDYGTRWLDKHIRTLTLAYKKAPHFAQYAERFFELLQSRPETISDLNVRACGWIMSQLGIHTRTRMSRELGIVGEKLDRPLLLARQLAATTYLAGPTAKPYTDIEGFRAAGIALEFKVYDYPEYPQLHGAFESNVTVLDLLFNCGPDARHYLKSLRPSERAA